MKTPDPEASQLIETIRRAFADCPQPTDQNIVPGDPYDDWEAVNVYKAYRGATWQDIVSNLEHFRFEPVGFLTTDARRYFLQGYMIACICDAEEADVLCDGILYELTPPQPGDRSFEFWKSDFDNLTNPMTRAQREAVLEYLRYDYAGSDKYGREKIAPLVEFWEVFAKQA